MTSPPPARNRERVSCARTRTHAPNTHTHANADDCSNTTPTNAAPRHATQRTHHPHDNHEPRHASHTPQHTPRRRAPRARTRARSARAYRARAPTTHAHTRQLARKFAAANTQTRARTQLARAPTRPRANLVRGRPFDRQVLNRARQKVLLCRFCFFCVFLGAWGAVTCVFACLVHCLCAHACVTVW